MASCEKKNIAAFLSHIWSLPPFMSQFIQWKELSHLILALWNCNTCLSFSLSPFLSFVEEGTSKRSGHFLKIIYDRQLLKVIHHSYASVATSTRTYVPHFYKRLMLVEVIDSNEKRLMTSTCNGLITKNLTLQFYLHSIVRGFLLLIFYDFQFPKVRTQEWTGCLHIRRDYTV